MKRPKMLSATFVRNVNRSGRYGDGRGGFGLSLLVKPRQDNGRLSKTWSQRLNIDGKLTNVGLGPYPLVTLKEARDRALENRRAVEQGSDPRAQRAASRVPTFAAAAEAVIRIHAETWRNGGRSEDNWRKSLGEYAMPKLGRKPVDKITTSDVLAVITPIWSSRRETAKRVRQRISQVMKWAVAEGHREDNPAGDAIQAALPKNETVKVHYKALPHGEVGAALRTMRGVDTWPLKKLALEFLVLTATRSNEVRGARWEEIDGAAWTIPAERMKKGREHRVPLARRALAVLDEARAFDDGSGLVFPSARRGKQSDGTLSQFVKELGIQAVPHGFRSSFRDWAAECSQAPREVCELALAHVNDDRTEAAYRRSDLFDLRRKLMEDWEAYLDV